MDPNVHVGEMDGSETDGSRYSTTNNDDNSTSNSSSSNDSSSNKSATAVYTTSITSNDTSSNNTSSSSKNTTTDVHTTTVSNDSTTNNTFSSSHNSATPLHITTITIDGTNSTINYSTHNLPTAITTTTTTATTATQNDITSNNNNTDTTKSQGHEDGTSKPPSKIGHEQSQANRPPEFEQEHNLASPKGPSEIGHEHSQVKRPLEIGQERNLASPNVPFDIGHENQAYRHTEIGQEHNFASPKGPSEIGHEHSQANRTSDFRQEQNLASPKGPSEFGHEHSQVNRQEHNLASAKGPSKIGHANHAYCPTEEHKLASPSMPPSEIGHLHSQANKPSENGLEHHLGLPKRQNPFDHYSHRAIEQEGTSPAGDQQTQLPTLALQDINYSVKYRVGAWWRGACFRHQHVKRVLRDVNLTLTAGELIGVIGSSGSGKTSLLDVIAYRTSGDVTGKMTYRGVTCTKRMMRQRASYVIQADRLLPNLTVRETLTFTAYLKLPSSVGRHQVEHKVDDAINRMGLRGVADSRVGGAVERGVSGGEKRRVTIALQLLKDPDILLLDEPTTGLDSFTARHLVGSLQGLARQGKLVVLSLHQPRSDIVKLLDHTALMCQGHLMFYGPTTQMVPYFTQLGYPCPVYANPFDTYIDIVSIDNRKKASREVTSQRVRQLLEAYKNSDLLHRTKVKVAQEVESRSSAIPDDLGKKEDSSGPGWFRIFFTVIRRMNVNLSRCKKDLISRALFLPLMIFFIVIFLGRLKHNQPSIQDRIGLLYNTAQGPPYVGVLNNVALFPALRDHFYREGLDGLYGSHTFLLAYTVHILPFAVVSSAACSSAMYWICGMYPELDRFGWHMMVVFWLHLSGEFITAIFMGIFRRPQLSNTIVPLILTAFGLVATGFLKSLQDLTPPVEYLSWTIVHKYASEIIVANEFHNLTLSCELEIFGVPCIENGDAFINESYPGAVEHLHRNVEVMVGMVIGYLLLAMLAFKVVGLKIMQ